MSTKPTLREKLAKEMFERHMGKQEICERVADALLPIIRAHAAEVANECIIYDINSRKIKLTTIITALKEIQ